LALPPPPPPPRFLGGMELLLRFALRVANVYVCDQLCEEKNTMISSHFAKLK
jgi:hypothetical protein